MPCEQRWCPLSIMLSMYGSRINSKLLFKYPVDRTTADPTPLSSYKQLTSSTFQLNKRQPDSTSEDEVKSQSPRDELEQLESFSDELLGNILSPGNTKICGKKFDLKVNGIRFVGFPLTVEPFTSVITKFEILKKHLKEGDLEHENCSAKPNNDSTLLSFNIVFVLKAVAEYSIVDKYQELSLQLGIALRFEEKCCQYLTEETRIMLSVHDEVSLESDDIATPEQVYSIILQKSKLAEQLSTIFTSLCETGIVSVDVNDSTHISFCLPHKVHNLTSDGKNTIPVGTVEKALEEIRPYHGILIFDKKEVWSTLPIDCSPELVRFLSVHESRKSLQTLALDADLPLMQVYRLASHLVYWGKARVIYPLCDSNVYVLGPAASLNPKTDRAVKFNEKFGLNMVEILSLFSLPVRLSDLHQNPHGYFYGADQKLIQIIFWLLQNRVVIQMHTYIFFSPTDSHRNHFHLRSPDLEPEIKKLFMALPEVQRKAILDVPASANLKDLSLFLTLLKYFDGASHLEEIMYIENLSRAQLLTVLDKFSPVLFTNAREDDTTAAFYSQK